MYTFIFLTSVGNYTQTFEFEDDGYLKAEVRNWDIISIQEVTHED